MTPLGLGPRTHFLPGISAKIPGSLLRLSLAGVARPDAQPIQHKGSINNISEIATGIGTMCLEQTTPLENDVYTLDCLLTWMYLGGFRIFS